MPSGPITIRLEPTVRARLREAARRRGLTASASVRLAIDAWLQADAAGAAARPYEELADILGRVDVDVRARSAAGVAGRRGRAPRRGGR